MVVYLDTSALLKLYIEEEGRELVAEAVASGELLATSIVAYAEARAGLARTWKGGDFTGSEYRNAVSDLDRDWSAYILVRVSERIAYHAGQLAEQHALRGFDAIHLASALHLAERFGELRFLAFDRRLTNAAREAGLTVYPPPE
jgi:uncharacterized protein